MEMHGWPSGCEADERTSRSPVRSSQDFARHAWFRGLQRVKYGLCRCLRHLNSVDDVPRAARRQLRQLRLGCVVERARPRGDRRRAARTRRRPAAAAQCPRKAHAHRARRVGRTAHRHRLLKCRFSRLFLFPSLPREQAFAGHTPVRPACVFVLPVTPTTGRREHSHITVTLDWILKVWVVG